MLNQDCRVLLVEDNAVNALVVQKMLKDADGRVFHVSHANTLGQALELICRIRFDAALVDLDLPDSSGLNTFFAIQRAAPSLAIVVLSGCESDEIAIKAVENGAQDYLTKQNLSRAELVRALSYGILRSRKSAEDRPARASATVLGFLGSKGGVGTTTLACHAARELKRHVEGEVLVTGLDANTAGVGHLMKVRTRYTLADAAQNLHRLDLELWKGLVDTTPDGVDVMPPPGAAEFTGLPDNDSIHQIVRFTRDHYRYIVVDLGTLTPLSLTILAETEHVYVVAAEELPAMWEAARLLSRLTQLGIARDHLHFVLNLKKRRGGLTVAELEKAFGYEVRGTVVEAREEMDQALADGHFVDPKSPVHKDVAKLIAGLLGKKPAAESPSARLMLARFVGFNAAR
jgi:pilus assembly protein CpaE